ncbi:GNAT family N-acetyltransferase [Mycolicibacterium doricum]|uniref:GNAT family N-acetyltransferase n=1 Tax=Mycolicibacterium doricum TaxID=126673 RepID=UPI000D6D8F53|nr:GNAT family N-acetyltransferase [Mycolicibacterium doricum]
MNHARQRVDSHQAGRSRGRPFTQVATHGDMICGHVTTGRCRDDDLRGDGEIWAIYVDPPRWCCGIGHRLIDAWLCATPQSGP